MAKSKRRSHGIPLLVLLALAHLSPITCEPEGDRAEGLQNPHQPSRSIESDGDVRRAGPIGRPTATPGSGYRAALAAGVLLVTAALAAKKLLRRHTPLHDRRVWLAGALLVYYFGVSGVMNNIIRRVPLYLVNRSNRFVFFFQSSGLQLGAEGLAVGFLYTVVGLLLAFVTHFLVHVEGPNMQRLLMAVAMLASYRAVRTVVLLDTWKTGYQIHGFWPSGWD